MLSRTLKTFLAVLLIWPSGTWPVFAQTASPTPSTPQAQAQKIKQRVTDIGLIKEVNVKLQSGEKVKGRISEINDDAFTVRVENKGQATTRDIRYDEVKSISAKDSKGGQIAYRAIFGPAGIGGAVLLVTLVAIAAAQRD